VALNPFTPGVLVRLRKMAADELAKAERDVRSGPGGMGWAHNESKRTECEEWLVFCRFAAEELHRA
jgi:hypothetical protein